jgi:hypothetical protein
MTAFYAEFYNLDPYLATSISEDVAHGDADRILPIDATARPLPDLIANCQLRWA